MSGESASLREGVDVATIRALRQPLGIAAPHPRLGIDPGGTVRPVAAGIAVAAAVSCWHRRGCPPANLGMPGWRCQLAGISSRRVAGSLRGTAENRLNDLSARSSNSVVADCAEADPAAPTVASDPEGWIRCPADAACPPSSPCGSPRLDGFCAACRTAPQSDESPTRRRPAVARRLFAVRAVVVSLAAPARLPPGTPCPAGH